MSEFMRSIIEKLHYRSNHITLLEASENPVDEYFKGNDGRNYRVVDSEDDEGNVILSMTLTDPYEESKYCRAINELIDKDTEYDQDIPEDNQTVWKILSPDGEVLNILPGSSSWIAVSDKIYASDLNLGLVEE